MTDQPKFSTDYMSLKEALDVLTPGDLQNIQDKAKILTFSDCLVWLGMAEDDIKGTDLDFAKKAHARGALDAIHTAATKLFNNMNTRNGALAALEYLRATSGTFQVDATPISPGKGGGFSFNVTMTPEDGRSDSSIDASSPEGTQNSNNKPALAEVSNA